MKIQLPKALRRSSALRPEAVDSVRPTVAVAMQHHAVRAAPILEPLFQLVNSPGDFSFSDWLMLHALAVETSPAAIVEVGRGYGNSTCTLLQVANEIGCPMVSVDLNGAGWAVTAPKLARLKGRRWTKRARYIDRDVTRLRPEAILPTNTGILFFWDAHGQQIADHLIRQWLPMMSNSLAVVHDISDLRALRTEISLPYRCGPFISPYDELPPLYDYWAKIGVEVRSPGLDLAEAKIADLEIQLPKLARPLIGPGGHWVYWWTPLRT